MTKKKKDYTVKEYPKRRRITSDIYDVTIFLPAVHGLAEYDITKIRNHLKECEEKTSKKYSLTAFFVYCLAQAIEENKTMNAMRKGKKKVVIFDDVDISLFIEVERNWKIVPVIYLVKAANRKSYEEINNEIQELKETKDKVSQKQDKIMKFYSRFPSFIRRAFIKNRYKYSPSFRRKLSGTASLTNVGSFTEGGGWGIPISGVSVFILIGGISKKPKVVDDKIVIRECVDVTFTFDHSVVDGAPMTRFTKTMKDLIETGKGVID